MKLEPGRYLGQTVRQRAGQGLLLTISRYEAGRAEPWHVHSNPTMCVLLGGQRRDRTPRVDFEQPPLTAVFHPTSEPHAGLVGPQGMLGFNIEFDVNWLERHELRRHDLGGYRPLQSVWARLGALRLFACAFRAGNDSPADLDGDALELLSPLVKRSFGHESLPRPMWLRRVEETIRDDFSSPLRLRDLAREARVHPVHLARVFRRHHGCSVNEYIRALRVAEAGGLILREGQSLAGAACATGFADQAHLCRWFSRLFGFSPKTLRSAAQLLQL